MTISNAGGIYKCRNGLLSMQYAFLICSSAGSKKYVTRRNVSIFIANLHAIFNDILRKKTWDSPLLRITTVSESVMGRVINFSQTDGIDE